MEGHRPTAERLPKVAILLISMGSCPAKTAFRGLVNVMTYAFMLLLAMLFFWSRSRSFSRNFRCSSALIPLSLFSLSSFLALSLVFLRPSAFSNSSSFRIFLASSSRVVLTRRKTSVRKCALLTRWSGNRRNAARRGCGWDLSTRRTLSCNRFFGIRSSSLRRC